MKYENDLKLKNEELYKLNNEKIDSNYLAIKKNVKKEKKKEKN